MNPESKWKFYLIAAAPVIALFFLIPFELYYNAREYWFWNRTIPLSFAGAGFFVYLPLALGLHLLFRINARAGAYASVFLFSLGLFILLADVFSPLQSSLLDGRELVSTEPLKNTLIEAAVLIALFALPFLLGLFSMTSAAVPITSVLVLISCIYMALVVTSTRPGQASTAARAAEAPAAPAAPEASETPPAGGIEGNVYHILLDEMQTDAALMHLDREGVRKEFAGFTVFVNNISNYLYTSASFPSYLTGTVYTGNGDGDGEKSFTQWKEGFKERGLLKDLYEKGYDITMYSPRHHWANPYASGFTTLDEVYEEETGIRSSQYGDFVQIWSARIMPNPLTTEALSAGKRLGRLVNALFNINPGSNERIPLTIPEGKEPYSTVLMLKRVVKKEGVRPGDGQYLYVHSILPHGPYVFTSECAYEPELRKKATEGYLSQVGCAFSLITTFMEELKRLGRYDSSTIIIHADTGHGHRGFIKKNKEGGDPGNVGGKAYLGNKLGWTREQVLARTRALLMIKPAHSTAPLEMSERPSQLVDLYPTLSALLGLNSDEAGGAGGGGGPGG
ncbi:MAG TPA: sulfatase-like hydrolase/transferase, partial [Thermodesulfobacteriota bacterium]|nr:sulfatase-like hydrolase/transferase [Thermodesulfobacteriota bacterium]